MKKSTKYLLEEDDFICLVSGGTIAFDNGTDRLYLTLSDIEYNRIKELVMGAEEDSS